MNATESSKTKFKIARNSMKTWVKARTGCAMPALSERRNVSPLAIEMADPCRPALLPGGAIRMSTDGVGRANEGTLIASDQ
jgi:hypothetical protein